MAQLNQSIQKEVRKTVKELVVEALSDGKALSARKIFASVKGQNYGFTYQGVHKAVKELSAEGVLIKQKMNYLLSSQWLETQKQKWNRIYDNHIGKLPVLSDIGVGESITYDFPNVISVPYWVIDQVPKFLSKDHPLVEHWYFAWPAQMVGPEQHRQMMEFTKSGGKRILCRDDSQGSIYCLKYLEKLLGSKWAAPVNVASECDVLTFRDYLVSIYWPYEFKELMVKSLNASSLEEGMRDIYDYVFNGRGSKLKVPVVITRNHQIATEIRKESLAMIDRFLQKARKCSPPVTTPLRGGALDHWHLLGKVSRM